MKDLIESLKSSRNVFLKVEGEAIEKWKNLPHNKEGLDLFLKFNIAEVFYGNTSFFCTSNLNLINRLNSFFNLKQFDKNDFESRRNLVLTWNLVDDKVISFSMENNWKILKFIPINPSNIQLLNKILNNLLKQTSNK